VNTSTPTSHLNGARGRPRPGRPRDPELAGRRRDQILRAATRLFAKRGYPCTDLQDVADALRLGKGTLYRYFPSKGDLFQAAVDRVMIGMHAAIDQAVKDTADPLDQIRLAIRRYSSSSTTTPSTSNFSSRNAPSSATARPPLLRLPPGQHRPLARPLPPAHRRRPHPPHPVDRITDAVGDLIYGTMFTNYMAARTRSLADQADDIVDLLFNGLLTAPERTRRTAARRRNRDDS